MWQEIINFINNDSIVSGIIAKVLAILEEIKRLKNNKVVISQDNEEGKNTNEISGLSNAKGNVEISQNNKKGDNSLNISF